MRDDTPETKRRIRRTFAGEKTWKVDDEMHQIEVDKVSVTSQPARAMFDFMLNDKGKMPGQRQSGRGLTKR